MLWTLRSGSLLAATTVVATCIVSQSQAQPAGGVITNANQQYRVVDPATAVAEGNAQVAGAPAQNAGGLAQVIQPPFPALTEAEEKYIDQVLQVWEKSTSQINTFECKFKRWVYNPNADETQPESISEGEIRYKNPDKGSFKENNRYSLAGAKPDGSPDYKINPRLPHGDW